MSSRDNQELMRAYTLLGQRIAKLDKTLAETSCMNPEIRELIAFIDLYNAVNQANDYQLERAALIHFGNITFPRKELTDLALKVGDTAKHGNFYAETDE